jgi:hypothetical protein
MWPGFGCRFIAGTGLCVPLPTTLQLGVTQPCPWELREDAPLNAPKAVDQPTRSEPNLQQVKMA